MQGSNKESDRKIFVHKAAKNPASPLGKDIRYIRDPSKYPEVHQLYPQSQQDNPNKYYQPVKHRYIPQSQYIKLQSNIPQKNQHRQNSIHHIRTVIHPPKQIKHLDIHQQESSFDGKKKQMPNSQYLSVYPEEKSKKIHQLKLQAFESAQNFISLISNLLKKIGKEEILGFTHRKQIFKKTQMSDEKSKILKQNTNPNRSRGGLNVTLNSSMESSSRENNKQKKSNQEVYKIIELSKEMILKIQKILQEVPVSLSQITQNLTHTCLHIHSQVDQIFKENNKNDDKISRNYERAAKMIKLIFTFLNKNFFNIKQQSELTHTKSAKIIDDIVDHKNAKQLAVFLLDLETKILTVPRFLKDIEKSYTPYDDGSNQDGRNLLEYIKDYQNVEHNKNYYYDSNITLNQDPMQLQVTHPHIFKSINIVDYPQKEKKEIKEQLEILDRMMRITTSSVATELKSKQIMDNLLIQKIVFGASFPRFLFEKDEADLRCFRIWRQPTVEDIVGVWNLPEKGAISYCKSIIFPSIKNSVEIYIPRGIDQEIGEINVRMSRTYIKQIPNSSPTNQIFRNIRGKPRDKSNSQYSSSSRQKNQQSFKKVEVNSGFPHYNQNIKIQKDIWTQPENHPQNSIKIRLGSPHKLIFTNRKLPQNIDVYNCCQQCGSNIHQCQCVQSKNTKRSKQEVQIYDTIVIYLHGGGFMALSCDTVQTYTRKWANQLGIPFFNVDYRKPPSYTFPTPVYDCLVAYQFIIQHISQYITNIKPKYVYLAGDSAGGNLCCSLQALLLQKNYNILPKGILLAYPAVDLRLKFTPSRLNSFNDPLLLPTLLILCLQTYLGVKKQDNQFNSLASPLLLDFREYHNQGYFKKQNNQNSGNQGCKTQFNSRWPKTTIMIGLKDPLYDDSLRLHEKLINNGIDSKLIIYKQLIHGFLNLDKMLPACQKTLKDAVQELEKLIISGGGTYNGNRPK